MSRKSAAGQTTFESEVSTKGQVVLPGPLRRRVAIPAGDSPEADIEAGRIALAPRRKRSHRSRIIADPVTGLPVLTAGKDAPILTSKEVEQILASVP